MADRFYGVNRGEHAEDLSEGAATSGKDVEVRFDLSAGMEKSEVLIALEEIKNYIIKGNYPPA